MAKELAFVLINPYTIAKSRTGGVIARYLARTDLDLVAARMFGPSKELVEKNDYLQKVYYGKEILNDLEKQLKKNNALKKTLSDKDKKDALLKLARYYIDLLSEE